MSGDRSVEEEVVFRGAVAFIEGHSNPLTPEQCRDLTNLVWPYHADGFVDDIDLACGFLEPGPDYDIDEALMYLRGHLAGLLTFEERLAAHNEFREEYNDFCRELGEDPDPDEPFTFPRLEGHEGPEQ